MILSVLSVTMMQIENSPNEIQLASTGDGVQREDALPADDEDGPITPRPIQNEPLSSTEANAKPASAGPGANTSELEKFLSAFPAKKSFQIQKDRKGKPVLISGGQFQVPKEQELEFVSGLLRSMGIPENQIQKSTKDTPPTSLSETSQYDQAIENYPVDQGFVRIFRKQKDQSIYYVMLEAKTFDDLDLRIKVTADEARVISGKLYQTYTGVETRLLSETAVVVEYPSPQLAWKVLVKTKSPQVQERQIQVSASTGKVLANFSLIKR